MLKLVFVLMLCSFTIFAQQPMCNAPRLSFIDKCDLPKDLHPCESKEDRELGRRFSHNCQTFSNYKRAKRNKHLARRY